MWEVTFCFCVVSGQLRMFAFMMLFICRFS